MKKIINQINIEQTIKIACILVVLLSVTSLLQAQPPVPGGDPNNAPIDGGLSLLIAGGVGYGIKKMRKRNTNDKC